MIDHRMDFNRPIGLTYLITDLKLGGVPLHLYRLATRLPRDQFRIQAISLADRGPVGEMLEQAGIHVSTCDAKGARDIRALGRLWRHLQHDPPDILHAMLFHANLAARLVGPLAGIPASRILCEIQTVEIERRWHLRLDGLTCRLCRVEFGNSPSVIDHLHERAGLPRTRLCCQWGAVDVQAIASTVPIDRASLGIPPEAAMILWTGRLDPIKNFEDMLVAVRRLRKQHPVRFVIVGDGPYRHVVERLINEQDLRETVLMLGQRRDIPRLLKAADLFLFCSRTEGLPNSILEAMAAGLPIVATNVPGCRDLVHHDRTGLLVELSDIEQTVDAMSRMITDRTAADRLGKQAHEWVAENADLRPWIAKWAQTYQRIRYLPESS